MQFPFCELEISENTTSKRALVKFVSGTKEPQEILVGPGTTVNDLFNHIGLEGTGFNISKGTPDTVFNGNENLFQNINDGELLYVSSSVVAGS